MDTTVQSSKPKPRPRPQVMKLTEAAAQRITELTKRANSEIVGLRVEIRTAAAPASPTRWNMPMRSGRPTKWSRIGA